MATTFYLGGTIIKKNPVSGRVMVKGKMLHFVAFFVHFDKLIRPHPGPLWGGWLRKALIRQGMEHHGSSRSVPSCAPGGPSTSTSTFKVKTFSCMIFLAYFESSLGINDLPNPHGAPFRAFYRLPPPLMNHLRVEPHPGSILYSVCLPPPPPPCAEQRS